MKRSVLLLCLVVQAALSFAADLPAELNMLDGSKIKGRIMSSTASEVTVMSDFGVLRIALDKLTAESRQSVSQASKPDTDALLKRITELEARVAQLQQENESLRRQSQSSVSPALGVRSFSPTTQAREDPSSGMQYSVSSTGKRHNSRCRYFGSGRSASANEGIACKICGG